MKVSAAPAFLSALATYPNNLAARFICSMTNNTKTVFLRLAITTVAVAAIVFYNPIANIGYAIFIVPIMFFAIYVWLGVAFFFCDLVWTLLTKPQERLFAVNMLSGAVMVTAALAAGYWLIRDSIGLGASIIYAIGAYFVLSIVRWFRRHTASYYAALDAETREAELPEPGSDKSN